MDTVLSDIDLLGPPVEDLATRRLRDAAGRALFEDDAPNLMKIGRFEIQEQIGVGGQGAVYLVYDPELDRKVALKQLTVAHPDHVAQLRGEALALAQVNHDNVVKVFEVGGDEVGRPFLVMELVEGQTLREWLTRTSRHWTEVVDTFIAIAHGLSAIHAANLVHRDVKPRNIVMTLDGRAKLVDLGIATSRPSEDARPTTSSGSSEPRAGTLGYMAPEQLIGESSPQSDQFAFCVTLFEALYGEPPPLVSEGSPSVLPRGRRAMSPESISEPLTANDDQYGERCPARAVHRAPKLLTAVLERGLRFDPGQRYPSMQALVVDLHRVRRPRRRWIAPLIAATGGAALAAVLLSSSPPDALCEESAPAAALWTGVRRDGVRSAFESTGSPDADRSFKAIDVMLEGAAGALDQRLTRACEADLDSDDQRLALAQIREEHGLLRSLVGSLTDVDASSVVEAPDRLAVSLTRLDPGPQDACELADPGATSQELDAMVQHAMAEGVAGHYDEALAEAQSGLEQLDGEAQGPTHALVQLVRGRLAFDARRLDLARSELETARSIAESLNCDGLGAEAPSLWAKAEILDLQPDVSAAEHAVRQALEKLDSLGDHDGPRRAQALNSHGLVLRKQGRYDDAITSYEAAIAIREAVDPVPVLELSDTYLNLGITQARQGNTDTAIETLQHARGLREQVLGPEHPSLYRLHASLSYRHMERGAFDASEDALRRAIELAAGLGAEHPRVAQLHIAMTRLLDRRHAFDEALEHARTADAILTTAHGPAAQQRVAALEAMGQVCLDAGWNERAIPMLEQALEIQAANGAHALDLAIGRGKLGRALAGVGQVEASLLLFDEALRPFEADPTLRTDAYYPDLLLRRGETLIELERIDEAAAALRKAESRWLERGDNPERLAITRWALARALCRRGAGQHEAQQALDYFSSIDTDGASATRVMLTELLEEGCSVTADAKSEMPAPKPDTRSIP